MKLSKRLMASVAVLSTLPATAHAGSDATFNGVTTLLEGWMIGSLGIVFGLGGIVYAGFQLFAGRYAAMFVGLAAALLFSAGPAVVKGIFTGVI